ncbi:MAG: hypothetical protein ABIK43_00800 [candidate division WOR-3 bacterium]
MAKKNQHARRAEEVADRAAFLPRQKRYSSPEKTYRTTATDPAENDAQAVTTPTAVVSSVITSTIENIFSLLEIPSQVQVEQTPDGFTVVVSPQNRVSLTSGRGRLTLRAIEHITWMIARRHCPNAPPVYIEIACERRLREDFLRKKALAIARIVTETGREMAIDMLSGPEQAVVRDAVKGIPGVKIHSVGSGLRQTVVVVPVRQSDPTKPVRPSTLHHG